MSHDGPKEACQTYVEQTKLLVTLASAFVVAPAALVPLLYGKDAVHPTAKLLAFFFRSEALFVASVLAGYFVLATIAGSQHKGNFDVHRLATRLFSLAQIACYLLGMWQFVEFVRVLIEQSAL
jgi:hypothetical protein